MKNWGIHFSIAKVEKEIEELDRETAKADFWDDPENSQKVLQILKNKKTKVTDFGNLVSKYEDIIDEYGLTTGEVNISMEIINEELKRRLSENLK